jgi:hypothetical protein
VEAAPAAIQGIWQCAAEGRVLAAIREAGADGLSRTFLLRKTQTLPRKTRDEILARLVERGDVVLRVEQGQRGAPAGMLFLAPLAPSQSAGEVILGCIRAAGVAGIRASDLTAQTPDVSQPERTKTLVGMLNGGNMHVRQGFDDRPFERYVAASVLENASQEELAAADADEEAAKAMAERWRAGFAGEAVDA